MNVSLIEIVAAAQGRHALLTAETAGYLLLVLAEKLNEGRLFEPHDVSVLETGDIMVKTQAVGTGAETERALRSVLGILLLACSGRHRALAEIASRVADAPRRTFVDQLESALIPLNRAAAKRAVARLQRETQRAIEKGKIGDTSFAEAYRSLLAAAQPRPASSPVLGVEPVALQLTPRISAVRSSTSEPCSPQREDEVACETSEEEWAPDIAEPAAWPANTEPDTVMDVQSSVMEEPECSANLTPFLGSIITSLAGSWPASGQLPREVTRASGASSPEPAASAAAAETAVLTLSVSNSQEPEEPYYAGNEELTPSGLFDAEQVSAAWLSSTPAWSPRVETHCDDASESRRFALDEPALLAQSQASLAMAEQNHNEEFFTVLERPNAEVFQCAYEDVESEQAAQVFFRTDDEDSRAPVSRSDAGAALYAPRKSAVLDLLADFADATRTSPARISHELEQLIGADGSSYSRTPPPVMSDNDMAQERAHRGLGEERGGRSGIGLAALLGTVMLCVTVVLGVQGHDSRAVAPALQAASTRSIKVVDAPPGALIYLRAEGPDAGFSSVSTRASGSGEAEFANAPCDKPLALIVARGNSVDETWSKIPLGVEETAGGARTTLRVSALQR